MNKKKPFKLPNFANKKTKQQSQPILTTFDDFFQQAITDEESGDRFLISDFSKSLRFYTSSINNYKKALQLNDSTIDDTDLIDCYYNLNRLYFNIYLNYIDVELVDLTNVEECADVLKDSFNLLILKKNHEDLIGKFESYNNVNKKLIDFIYNLSLINLEILEKTDSLEFDTTIQILNESIILLNKVFDHQLNELDESLQHSTSNSTTPQTEQNNTTNDPIEEEYEYLEQVTPNTILESLITSLKIIQTSLESCENLEQLSYVQTGTQHFIQQIEKINALIITRFSNPTNPTETTFTIDEELLEEINLLKTSIDGIHIHDFQTLVKHWGSYSGPETSSRFLAESDNFQNLLEFSSWDQPIIWEILTHINKSLQKAQTLILNIELKKEIQLQSSEISSKYAKIVEILIRRADNEIIRSLLQIDSAIKNKSILISNGVALLKNAVQLLDSGKYGLLERISDRYKRFKLKRECLVRLVVIKKVLQDNGIVTLEDFKPFIDAKYIDNEIKSLGEIELYRSLLDQ